MPWNSSTKIMTTPISIGDISQAVGLTSGDLGTLIVDGLINKWAKWKPFRSSSPGFPFDRTLSTPELRSPDRAAAALNANYGMSIPVTGYSTINQMIANLSAAEWTYLKPRGGNNNEPFRALDFDGYESGATPPITPLQSTTNINSSESTVNAGLGFTRNIASQTGYLTLDDLHINGHSISDSFGEYYFGICLYYSDTVRYASTMSDKYKTIQASLSEIGLSVRNVSVPGSGSRTYRAIPFFASIPFDTMPLNYQGSLYALPFAECSVVITRMQDVWCAVVMYTLMGDTSDKLYYQYKIVNPTTSARTYTANVWALRSYNINDTYGNAIRTDNSVSVAAGSSYTLPLQTITDGILVRDILSVCPAVGVEIKVGEVRSASAVSSIYVDADPSDPPTL